MELKHNQVPEGAAEAVEAGSENRAAASGTLHGTVQPMGLTTSKINLWAPPCLCFSSASFSSC